MLTTPNGMAVFDAATEAMAAALLENTPAYVHKAARKPAPTMLPR